MQHAERLTLAEMREFLAASNNQGGKENPVRHIRFSGFRFTHTKPTGGLAFTRIVP